MDSASDRLRLAGDSPAWRLPSDLLETRCLADASAVASSPLDTSSPRITTATTAIVKRIASSTIAMYHPSGEHSVHL